MEKVKWIGAIINSSGIMSNNKSSILTIGTDYQNPSGGIAFVLQEYAMLFRPFNFICTTKSRGKISKAFTLISALIKFTYALIFKDIRIIHIHSASYNSFFRKLIFVKIALRFKKKIILHIHGGSFNTFYENSKDNKREKIKYIINKVDGIVCLSKFWESYFSSNFNPKRIYIIPNIVPSPKEWNAIKNNRKQYHFLFLGKVCKEKGCWDLLEVIHENKTLLWGKAIFHIGGNGETEKLKQLIKEYNIADIVKFEGWISGDKKIKLLQNSDIYILPSYNEGLPISILEAMSYSMPILSTTVGGIPEVVDESNGILTEPGNKVQLWESIQLLLSKTPEERAAMGLNSYNKVKPHLPSSVKEELDSLYKNL